MGGKYGEECGCDRRRQTMKEREKWSERVRREWREVGRKGRSCFSRIQLALASIKDVRAAFSPGEELDDGIAQELQSLVVIDPGQDEREETEEGGGWEGWRCEGSWEKNALQANSSSRSIISSRCP